MAASPSAETVRQRVLEEHAEIRPLLDGVEKLAQRFEHGEEQVGRDLRKRGFGLYERLAAHMDVEEELLLSRLRGAGDRGRQLAERLAREHAEQRELLEYLLGRLGESTLPTLLIARELVSFVEYVRLDMSHEEHTLLANDLLAD